MRCSDPIRVIWLLLAGILFMSFKDAYQRFANPHVNFRRYTSTQSSSELVAVRLVICQYLNTGKLLISQ